MHFKEKNIQTEYSVLGYRIDLYFHDYKLAIEVDEFGLSERNIDYEIEIQKAIEKELACKFIRINPDVKDYNNFKAINKIKSHIEKSTREALRDEI